MSHQEPEFELSPELDRRLEALLRADAAAEPYVEDAGFTAAVMAAMPPPARRRSYSWLGPALGGVGALALARFSSLPEAVAAPLRAAVHGHLPAMQSLFVLVPMAVMMGCAAWFAASETN
jgi:hypothetical protein